MKRAILAIFTLVMMTAAATASDKLLSIDMNITDHDEPVSIKVNLPLNLIGTMVPQITQALENAELEENDVNLREIWAQVRAAGPNEYVDINKADGHIEVYTTETHVKIDVTDAAEGEIHITVPLALGDLIFGEEGIVNVEDVIAALENWEGDIVTVTGDKVNGRVWVH